MKTILHEQLLRLGWPGIVGIGLAFFCLSLYLSALRPLQVQLNKFTRQPAAADVYQPIAVQHNDDKLGTPEQKLQQFYQRFPAIKSLPQLLDTLYRVAAAQDIKLEKGEYLPHSEKSNMLVRYQITLPVKGTTYPQLRRFVRTLLHDIPAATLEGLRIEKQHVGDSTISAELHLVIYLGEKH